MQKYQLTCCSTADVTEEFYKSRDIDYICFHFNLDGVEYADDLGKSIPFDRFYKMIADGAMPVTSQVGTGEYVEFWESYLMKGIDILHVTLSSGISGTINSAMAAKELLDEKYPDRKIMVLDSLAASSGYGLFMDYLADKRDEGMSMEELYEWGMANRLYVHHWFFSTDLTSYYRGGRISRTSAAVGNLLGICPLMNVNDEGKLIPRRNIRSKKRVISEIVKVMAAHVQDGAEYSGKCMLSQSACIEDAEAVVQKVEEICPKLKGKIIINSIGTVIGSHTGPGTVALFFMGDKRTA
ncbi:MAG: DegV family protein [Lachnospiraceae bacterium]|nr:DegV family protein [Lachnospiraceae bacterium]